MVFPTGFSKDSPHIFPERVFGGVIYITSPDFFPLGFQGVIWLITRPQEDQIDYKEEENWSRGSVMKKLVLVINLYNS